MDFNSEVPSENYETVDALFATNIIPLYIKELDNSVASNNYENAEKISRKYKRISS